ncbi:branched-chain amino acid ABC transporter permease [Thermococcus stetteri]|uniref:branched-chain amino acid ABC transporter permease n=1 Tax=Thermococcus stetteri TaxID=49900 RepID=UPI001AE7221F|nr:branched-chain amino acid ABC transporter permease [Thermococcus stetteri]MBP1911980.1 branched-chain amino acid transport system permease protein [Thermococcus stetteri]
MGVIDGAITYANLLALLALGLTLTYITTAVPNFAHGSFAVIGSYLAYTLLVAWGINPYIAVVPAFIIGGLFGTAVYLLTIRPLIKKGASVDMLMMATLAIDIILYGSLGAYSDYLSGLFKRNASKFVFTNIDFTIGNVPGRLVMSTLLVLGTLLGLYILLYKTKFGIALRASMENPALAEAMGIDVEMTRLFSWFLAAAVAGMVGAVLPFLQETVPGTGGFIIVSVFAASIVGGLRNIAGGLIGGYIIGLSESLVTYGLSDVLGTGVLVYSKVVSLLIMVVVLLVLPEGITGTKLWRRLMG